MLVLNQCRPAYCNKTVDIQQHIRQTGSVAGSTYTHSEEPHSSAKGFGKDGLRIAPGKPGKMVLNPFCGLQMKDVNESQPRQVWENLS